eukprot:TRINITY_DN1038_c0_g1_i1.p1 TRINITY_DN1038_c0_g1~~TRINITY_DN1038_c0_g1_i1.p1  ORF type:complete len:337 (-),score=67.07 TRINITY_DN1038_c0_g1_i1:421-1431(-)
MMKTAGVLLGLGLGVTPGSARTALLVVDVQDCFLEAKCTSSAKEGSLSVPACDVIEKINMLQTSKSCLFDEVIWTQDYHPAGHISFGSTHGLAPFAHLGGKGGLDMMCISPQSGLTSEGACCPSYHLNSSMDCETNLCPPAGWSYAVNNSAIITANAACETCASNPGSCFAQEQAMWTDHCLQDGDATFPTSLIKNPGDTVVQKGMNKFVDAYSGFMDNTQTLKTSLDATLQAKGIKKLYIVGIATDVCVQWTVTDALGANTANYDVTVIKDATAAVLGDVKNYNMAMGTMASAGAKIVTTADVLTTQCPSYTCGDIKGKYRTNGCCGDPNKLFNL